MSYSMSRLRTLHKNSMRLQVPAMDSQAYIDLVVKEKSYFFVIDTRGQCYKTFIPAICEFLH